MNVNENSESPRYPLSSMQSGMLFHSLSAPGSGVEIEQIISTVREPLNLQAFERAWEQVIDRHSVLRTRFAWEGIDEPEQVVEQHVSCQINYHDLSAKRQQERETALEVMLDSDRHRDFTMSEAPLMRLNVLDYGAEGFVCVWTFHHAILDGRSFPTVLSELFDCYESFCEGKALQLPEPAEYQKYIQWLQKQDFTVSREHWQQTLKGFTAPTSVSVDFIPSVRKHTGGNAAEQIHLSKQCTLALATFVSQFDLTLNTAIQGAWSLLLYHYSGEEDVVFGATRACRYSTVENSDSMVGLFINTLPMRVQIEAGETLLGLLRGLRNQQIELRKYEHTPLPDVQRWSEVPAGYPLFETMVVFENYLLNTRMREKGGRWLSREFEYRGQTGFPLTLIGYLDDELILRIEYDTQRFEQGTIQRMLGHLRMLLEGMNAESIDRPAASIPYVTPQEREQLLFGWNPVAEYAAVRESIIDRFQAQVDKAPDATALTYEDESVSYKDLDYRANKLANALVSLGVGPDVLVGIYVERSVEMIIGILAILKAGGGYVPLDPLYPKDRIGFILEDTRVPVLLTLGSLENGLPEHAAETICIDEFFSNTKDVPGDTAPHAGKAGPDNIAYVIYTSGSTGQPKGVKVTHGNVVRLFDATDAWFGFGADDVWTLFHSYAFDFSVWEIWGALLYGGRLVIVPYWISRSPEKFYQLAADEKVTVLNQTPSAFRQFIDIENNIAQRDELALRYIIFGGEALDLQSLTPWVKRHGDKQPQLVNMYGITETTVHVTYRVITEKDIAEARGSVIGVPIPDLQIYLLDPYMQPVPVGVKGEIYVGGRGVSKGYLNRPELTEKIFIRNPFDNNPESTLYKTGDVARYLPNRDLEYLGRCDKQVKIRGFRIEVGEIETRIKEHDSIKEAVITVSEGTAGDKRLIAYIVPADSDFHGVSKLRDYLQEKLPVYMIPSVFVAIDALPLTQNGKVDYKALPLPTQTAKAETDYVAPRTKTEKVLCDIWSDVLGFRNIGINDDYFELGGDSILSISIISRAKSAGLHLTPQQIFNYSTIAKLAPRISLSETINAEQGQVQGVVPLLPVQRWFFAQRFARHNHWNQAYIFKLSEKLDVLRLKQALERVMRHHDAFRLRFVNQDGNWIQAYDESIDSDVLSDVDLSSITRSERSREIEKQAEMLQGQLDINQGPMLRAAYFHSGDAGADRLLIVIHHLVVDGVSWQIFVRDLEHAYLSASDADFALPEKTTSLQSWSRCLADYANNRNQKEVLSYWESLQKEKFDKIPEDKQNGSNTEESARTVLVSLDEHMTQAFLRQIPRIYNTQANDILLLALLKAFASWREITSLVVDLEGHGREEIDRDIDISRTIGWFTTIFPLSLKLNRPADLDRLIKDVKEQIHSVPKRGFDFMTLQYLSGDRAVKDMIDSLPRPQVLFNYLGQTDQITADSKLFDFADESTGCWHDPELQRTHMLEFLGAVKNGRLGFSIIYSDNIHQSDSIKELADYFITALNQIIEHCLAQNTRRFTPSDFPLANLSQSWLDSRESAISNIDDICALSPMQRLFYNIDTVDADIGFEQWHFILHGELDCGSFKKAWQSAVQRHGILRTAFEDNGLAEPSQIVYRQVSLPWEELDWRSCSEEEQQLRLDSYFKHDRSRHFDLTQAPLIRVALIRVADDRYHLVWSTHHLIIDGWSWPLLFNDLASLYVRYEKNQPVMQTAAGEYRDYIAWLHQRNDADEKQFWQSYLQGFSRPNVLVQQDIHIAGEEQKIGEHQICLSVAVTDRLNSLARQNHITLNVLFQGIWACMLGAYCQQDDVVFGISSSGRPADLPSVENIIGPFVNNLPVRASIRADQPFIQWLQEFQNGMLEITEYEQTQLSNIQEWSEVPLRYRIFESLLVFQNYVSGERSFSFGPEVSMENIALPEATNYPITLVIAPGNEIVVKVYYHRAHFDDTAIMLMTESLNEIISAVASDTPARVSDVTTGKMKWIKASATQEDVPASDGKPQLQSDYVGAKTDIEKQIVDICKDVFGVEQISLTDNFFDLGGHSVLLVAMHKKLEEALKTTFPVTRLFQYPSISAFLAHLDDSKNEPRSYADIKDRGQLKRDALRQKRIRKHAKLQRR